LFQPKKIWNAGAYTWGSCKNASFLPSPTVRNKWFHYIPDRTPDLLENAPVDKNGWRAKVYRIIFRSDTRSGRLFDIALFLLIIANMLVLVLETIESASARFGTLFYWLDKVFLFLFSVEILLRILVVRDPKKYIFSFYGVIDLCAVLPGFLEFLIPETHLFMLFRSFRLLRAFRIFNMVKFMDESRYLVLAIVRSTRKILIFLFFVLLLATVLGSLIYFFEIGHNPNFSSIPQSIYWAIVTITTVGYGDVTPVTVGGKVLASFVMILGYAIIAVPTGVLSASMIGNSMARKRDWKNNCPHCGLKGHEADALFCRKCGGALEIRQGNAEAPEEKL